MRTLTTIILFAALSMSAFAQKSINSNIPYFKKIKAVPQASQATLRATNAGPNETLHYMWNGSDWDTISLTISTYQNSGLVSSSLILDYNIQSGNFDTTSLVSYTYNTTGVLLEELHKDWQNGVWENSMKYTFTYDNHNYLTGSHEYYWDGSAWELSAGEISNYTYNSLNLPIIEITEYYDAVNSVWVTEQKNEIYYSAANEPDSIHSYTYVNGAWDFDTRMYDIQWHNFSKFLIISFIIKEKYNNVWEDANKIEFTFNNNDQETSIVYSFEMFGSFVDFMKYSFTYDSYGNETSNSVEMKTGLAYEMIGGENHTNTYLDGKLSEKETEFYEYSSSTWIKSDKFQYKYDSAPTGVENRSTDLIIKAYPNPFKNDLTIAVSGLGTTDTYVAIFDMAGRKVHEEMMPSENDKNIDLSGLNKGIYFINISANGSQQTLKVVKQ